MSGRPKIGAVMDIVARAEYEKAEAVRREAEAAEIARRKAEAVEAAEEEEAAARQREADIRARAALRDAEEEKAARLREADIRARASKSLLKAAEEGDLGVVHAYIRVTANLEEGNEVGPAISYVACVCVYGSQGRHVRGCVLGCSLCARARELVCGVR
jgi:hypothetical protein